MEAIERAVDEEKACGGILHLVASVRGGIAGPANGLLEAVARRPAQTRTGGIHMVPGAQHDRNVRRGPAVTAAAMMVIEIGAGSHSGSMVLGADLGALSHVTIEVEPA